MIYGKTNDALATAAALLLLFGTMLDAWALMSLLFAGLGVLVSMTAATVRQAGQRMLIPFLAIYALPGLLPLVLPRLPVEWLARVELLDAVQIVPVLATALALADGALCGAALARFRRARVLVESVA